MAAFAKRSRPHIIVFHDDCTVASVDPALSDDWPRFAALAGAFARGTRCATFVFKTYTITMTRVPDQSLIVMCIEQYRERPDFATAVSRYNLTPRQIEIARLLVMGLRIADIAGELVLAESTVAQHVKRLLLKTKTRNRAALIAGLLGYNSQSKNGMAAVPYDVYTMKRDKTAYAIT